MMSYEGVHYLLLFLPWDSDLWNDDEEDDMNWDIYQFGTLEIEEEG